MRAEKVAEAVRGHHRVSATARQVRKLQAKGDHTWTLAKEQFDLELDSLNQTIASLNREEILRYLAIIATPYQHC